MPTVAVVSFRLGGSDGVSVVAGTWIDAFRRFGFDAFTVAGEGPVDALVPGLAIAADEPPDPGEVAHALSGADLVVVENLCTIPLNLAAAEVVAREIAGRPAILHHHDPPWQRDRFAHVETLPPDDPEWQHVTVNDFTRVEMAERGIGAVTVRNAFDTEARRGSPEPVRRTLELADDELVVGHPVRAIPRKNVPAAVALAEELDATYWLMGPAEDGYAAELGEVLGAARCRVVHAPPPTSMADAYAACHLVAFPSTWEGWGNPPIEAAIHHRPAAVGHYPAAEEQRAAGVRYLDPGDVGGVAAFLRAPDEELLEANHEVVCRHYSLAQLESSLVALLDRAGWRP